MRLNLEDPENTIPVINRLEVLPYWPTYAEWLDHLDECSRCAHVICEGSREIPDLCKEGQAAQFALTYDLQVQSTVATLN